MNKRHRQPCSRRYRCDRGRSSRPARRRRPPPPGPGRTARTQKNLTVAVFNGWDEGIAASELWKAILDEKGYNVELEYADVAPVYAGLTTDDYDVVLDTWLPVTHADYVEEYGDEHRSTSVRGTRTPS